MIVLENNQLQVQIATKGAELTRIFNKTTELEYLWKGDAAFWKRQAPILFPIVGKLVDNTYWVNGTSYELPQHGFARDYEFAVLEQQESNVLLEFVYSNETLQVYPYKFALQIGYQLQENQLKVTYKVINVDSKNIFFSIGGHPAFNCPLVENTSFEDYYLAFEKDEQPLQHFLNPKTGFRKAQPEKVSLQKHIALSYSLFENDALMYENLESKKISLLSNKHSHGIHFYIPNWQYMAFWTQKGNAPFICFEPWMGIADAEDTNQQYESKTGILELPVAQVYENNYSCEFF